MLAQHVHDRIVHEDEVELPFQPKPAHIAHDMRAFGIDLAAQRQHPRRNVGQGQVEMLLEVQRVIPAATTQLQHCGFHSRSHGQQRLPHEPRLADIGFRVGQKVKPRRQLPIDRGLLRTCILCSRRRHMR
jgi:hypothetical protein